MLENRTNHTKKNRILKGIVAASLSCVIGLTAVFAYSLYHSNDQGIEKSDLEENTTTKETLVKEAGAFRTDEKQASYSSGNDGRKVVRIVEVIPHPICSVFPYLIEWGSKENYDDETFLGYEGIRYVVANSNNMHYTRIQEGTRADYLTEYPSTFDGPYNWVESVGWRRETKPEEVIPAKDTKGAIGYFEYVGNNKGLYSINLKQIVEASSDEYGIRYRIKAMERAGNENKRGEWEVNNPGFYWGKDYATISSPTGDDVNIRTDYNYDLKFRVGTDPVNQQNYRVRTVMQDKNENAEYEAIYLGNENLGFTYQKGGNYQVSIDKELQITALSKYIQKPEQAIADGYTYVWAPDTGNALSKADGKGHFRLLNPVNDVLTKDSYLYQLSFSHVEPGKGNYILLPSAVLSKIAENDVPGNTAPSVYNDLQFEYAGKGKGTYNVSFIYCGTMEHQVVGSYYQAQVERISDGGGRYSLTSKEKDPANLYKKVGDGKGDYSKVVTKIDCAGVDYTRYQVSGYAIDPVLGFSSEYNGNLPGLTMGCSQHNYYRDDIDKGQWVFHSVSSDEVNGYTTIEQLERDPRRGDRIYVYNQYRKNRYYTRTGFKSTEWFKLLMYINDGEQSLGYADYAAGMAPDKVVEKHKDELADFDRSYRIEIVQRTPSELTTGDVDNADLIFFSSGITLPGMSIDKWNQIRSALPGRGLPGVSYDSLQFTDDFSATVLMSLYKHCLYDQDTALMLGSYANGGGLGEYVKSGDDITSNFGKLFLMANLFKDPRDFGHFIEGYPEKIERFSTIHKDGTVTAYLQSGSAGNLYNFGNISIYDENVQLNPETPNNAWYKAYFRVVELIRDPVAGYWKISPLYTTDERLGYYDYNWVYSGDFRYGNLDVNDGRCWYFPGSIAEPFYSWNKTLNVWHILHNKKSKQNSEPVVIVTNADGDNISTELNVTPIYYFYVDDYSTVDDFAINFKVNWRPEEVTEPAPLQSVTVSREGGALLYSIPGPSYKTEYTYNVASDFMNGGSLNPDVTERTYDIVATDVNGKADMARVIVIARETFMLN